MLKIRINGGLHMFRYFKLKRQKLELEVNLLSRLYLLVDGMPDIIEIAKQLKGLDGEEFMKKAVEVLVDIAKPNDENGE